MTLDAARSISSSAARRQRLRLRPWPLRRLPRDLQAARVGQLAAAIEGGVRSEAFAQLLSRVDTGPMHPGNRVDIFSEGQAAFAAMLSALAGAQREILFESYILEDDATGQRFLAALQQAASRGVAVRVLADAFGSFGTRGAFWHAMQEEGIEVRLFHRLFPNLWNQSFRDHRKILVVDRRLAFTGGMNIADEYGSSTQEAREGPWRDTHARLEGPAAQEMALVFNEGWLIAGGRSFGADEAGQPPVEAGSARALVLDSRPGRGNAETAAALAAMLGGARERAWITNAYFAPGHLAVGLLCAAARRGLDVRLLLPGRSDVPLARHAGHGYFESLLLGGVRVFEYTAAVLHAKSLLLDDYVSVVGSTNLDFRSFRFNAECNLVVLDFAVAQHMAAIYEQDLEHSREIRLEEWRRRPWPHRLGDAAARLLSPVL
jgi:cardiolipin synthase